MQKFDKRNEVVLAAIEKLKKKNAALEKEWTALDGSEVQVFNLATSYYCST